MGNQCLIDKGYSIKARKCINWTRFGAIDLAITEDAKVCRPLCKALLGSLLSVTDDMKSCENKPEDDSVERGGKGKKRNSSVETFQTDGFMMFDDEVVEDELQEGRLDATSRLEMAPADGEAENTGNSKKGKRKARKE